MEKEKEEDAAREFVRTSFAVLPNDALAEIFSYMTAADIVKLCPMLGDRCGHIKWVYVLRKITGMDLLEANFDSLVSIADQSCRRWYKLNWPLIESSNRYEKNLGDSVLNPTVVKADQILSESNITLKLCVPLDSVVNYWILVTWYQSEPQGQATAHNTYDELLLRLEDDLYYDAFNELKIEDFFDADRVFETLEELGLLERYPEWTRDSFAEYYPANITEDDSFDTYDLSRIYQKLFDIPTVEQLKKFLNDGQGYYRHPVIGGYSISHTTFH